jgi:hypothetical protein
MEYHKVSSTLGHIGIFALGGIHCPCNAKDVGVSGPGYLQEVRIPPACFLAVVAQKFSNFCLHVISNGWEAKLPVGGG